MFRSFGRLRSLLDNWFDVIALATGVLTLIAVMLQSALGASSPQKTFPTPEEAVRALIGASKGNETKPILDILGPEAKSFLETGDPVSDRETRQRLTKNRTRW